MAKIGSYTTTQQGNTLNVFATFPLEKIDTRTAEQVVSALDFGTNVQLSIPPAKVAWRNRVIVVGGKTVFTVQVIYQSVQAMGKEILASCRSDARRTVVNPILRMLITHDVDGNILPPPPPKKEENKGGGQQNRRQNYRPRGRS